VVREAWLAVDLAGRLGTTERALAGVAALVDGAGTGKPERLLAGDSLTLSCTRVVPLVGWEGGLPPELRDAGDPPPVLLLLSGRPAEELPGLVGDTAGWADLVIGLSLDGGGSPELCHGPRDGLAVLSGVRPPALDANAWLSLPELGEEANRRLREAIRTTRASKAGKHPALYCELALPGDQVDRTGPLARLLEPLHRPGAERRSVWLWGEGGSGKTALLILAARLEAGRWRSVVAVSCRELADPGELVLRMAGAMGFPPENMSALAEGGPEERLAALVSRLETPRLLVLDDLSEVQADDGTIPEAWARSLRRLAALPRTALVVSSRIRPRFEGDQSGSEAEGFEPVELGGMTPEEAAAYLDARLGSREDFPGTDDPDTRHWIETHVGTHALTLSLLAGAVINEGWNAVRNDPQIVLHTARERFLHRMWEALTADEATEYLLHALALLEIPVPRTALRKLTGREPLERLDRWSVLEGPLLAGERWSAPHPVIATDWRTRLPEALPEKGRLELAGELADVLVDEGNRLKNAQLHAEAVRLLLEAGRTADAVQLLRDGLAQALDRFGLWRLRERLLRRVLDAEDLEPGDRAALLGELASTLHSLGNLTEAKRLYRESLKIAEALGNRLGIASTLHNLAVLAQNRGDLAEAERLYRESLEIAKDLGHRSGIAITFHQLGILAQDRGDLPEAERLYRESLEIENDLGDRSGIASTLHQLGKLAQDRGDLPEAERLYRESLEIENDLGNRSGIASTLGKLGILAQARGDLVEAERLYRESLEIKEDLGDRSGIASMLHQLGRLAQDRGDLAEAERLYRDSLEIKENLGDRLGIAITLGELGILAQDRGDLPEAERLYREVLETFECLGNRLEIANVLHQLGKIAYFRGDFAEAERWYRKALEIFKDLRNRLGIAITLGDIGMLAQVRGDLAEAERLYRESLEIKKDLGDRSGIARTLDQLGVLAQNRGELVEAERSYRKALEIKEDLGDRSGIAITLGQLGLLAEARGDQDAALEGCREAMQLFAEIGAARDEAFAGYHVARLLAERGNVADAAVLAAWTFGVLARSGDRNVDASSQLLMILRDEIGPERLRRAFDEALGESADATWELWNEHVKHYEEQP